MQELSSSSQAILYLLLAIMGLLALIVWGWQILVLRGKEMKNPDGSADSWHEQKNSFLAHRFSLRSAGRHSLLHLDLVSL